MTRDRVLWWVTFAALLCEVHAWAKHRWNRRVDVEYALLCEGQR